MNSTAVRQPELEGTKPSRFGLRTRVLVLFAVFALTMGVVAEAKAHYIYGNFWGANTYWSWNGNFCYSTLGSNMIIDHHANPSGYQTRAQHTFGWGTGQPWCYGVAAKGWVYGYDGVWTQGSWGIAYNGNEANGYSPWKVAWPGTAQGQAQYQAYHNSQWSNYFQWGNIMYPP